MGSMDMRTQPRLATKASSIVRDCQQVVNLLRERAEFFLLPFRNCGGMLIRDCAAGTHKRLVPVAFDGIAETFVLQQLCSHGVQPLLQPTYTLKRHAEASQRHFHFVPRHEAAPRGGCGSGKASQKHEEQADEACR